MDTIRWFRDRAKALLKGFNRGDDDARRRISAVFRDEGKITLQKAQHVVAIEAGCGCWKDLLDTPEMGRRLAIAMTQEPLLNDFGIGLFSEHGRKPPGEKARILAEDREKLRGSLDDVAWTVRWLGSNIEPIKTINRRHSSYGLKHLAERQGPRRYLTNGVFIAAAIIAEYPCKTYPGSPNACFGMSERSIKRLSQ